MSASIERWVKYAGRVDVMLTLIHTDIVLNPPLSWEKPPRVGVKVGITVRYDIGIVGETSVATAALQ